MTKMCPCSAQVLTQKDARRKQQWSVLLALEVRRVALMRRAEAEDAQTALCIAPRPSRLLSRPLVWPLYGMRRASSACSLSRIGDRWHA